MRKPQFVINNEKHEELLKRLKPITNWSDVEKEQLIFHKNDNNIFNINKFFEYNEEDNIIWYKDRKDRLYDMSATGWYYYDESIADEIEEMFIPKLFCFDKILTVAFNKEEAFNNLKEYRNLEGSNLNEIEEIKEIDDYEIVLK